MFAATSSVALVGGEPREVRVEAHVGRAKEAFKLSGLPDTAMREAKDRVRAAVVSSGISFPNRTVTVNLAPADLPKRGTDYDLPIAIGVLAAQRQLPASASGVIAVGELALDGSVRPGTGILGAAALSAATGRPCLVARSAAADAARVPGAAVHPVATLSEAIDLLRRGLETAAPAVPGEASLVMSVVPDLAEVRGQPLARRALELAAAGGHHLFLHGPPGGGKTMLARRLPGILPAMTAEEALEVSLLWSAAGKRRPLALDPPFRSPHHTASVAALVGGGSGVLTPGEVSLAHRGVLFLDELGEFPRNVLDSLRQPLEDGVVSVSRRGGVAAFPSRFQIIGASNPCPCGFHGDDRKPCECPPSALARYRRRLSGPFLDRFDLVIRVSRPAAEAVAGPPGEESALVRGRVDAARALQHARGSLNRDLSRDALDADAFSPESVRLLRSAVDSGRLTARGYDRVRRVARTIADVEGVDEVSDDHVAEALALRGGW